MTQKDDTKKDEPKKDTQVGAWTELRPTCSCPIPV